MRLAQMPDLIVEGVSRALLRARMRTRRREVLGVPGIAMVLSGIVRIPALRRAEIELEAFAIAGGDDALEIPRAVIDRFLADAAFLPHVPHSTARTSGRTCSATCPGASSIRDGCCRPAGLRVCTSARRGVAAAIALSTFALLVLENLHEAERVHVASFPGEEGHPCSSPPRSTPLGGSSNKPNQNAAMAAPRMQGVPDGPFVACQTFGNLLHSRSSPCSTPPSKCFFIHSR